MTARVCQVPLKTTVNTNHSHSVIDKPGAPDSVALASVFNLAASVACHSLATVHRSGMRTENNEAIDEYKSESALDKTSISRKEVENLDVKLMLGEIQNILKLYKQRIFKTAAFKLRIVKVSVFSLRSSAEAVGEQLVQQQQDMHTLSIRSSLANH
ncbi:hypothetical protein RRG08_029808 [Elysia crispata]|uniref:Uncharacterized protein n=1 Tax=Elysia crispata TaxID=231223 RepID=A0AAE0YM60_9GAST|nr:hypothetical protein RRG08_029808 [Elysia crispata]